MTPDARQRLWADLDLRLAPVYVTLWRSRDPNPEEIAAILRFAYGSGYTDALAESEPGKLLIDHGLLAPEREG